MAQEAEANDPPRRQSVLLVGPRKQRCPKTRKRLSWSWVCEWHQHHQCTLCAALGLKVSYCNTRGHHNHPKIPSAARMRRQLASQSAFGDIPATKRHQGHPQTQHILTRHIPCILHRNHWTWQNVVTL